MADNWDQTYGQHSSVWRPPERKDDYVDERPPSGVEMHLFFAETLSKIAAIADERGLADSDRVPFLHLDLGSLENVRRHARQHGRKAIIELLTARGRGG